MPNPLAILLHDSLDYAGIFPPASLAVADAVTDFFEESALDTAGLLSRFVCPINRIEPLATAFAARPVPVAWPRVSALLRGGRDAGEFLASLEIDLAVLGRLRDRAPKLCVDTVELRVPADITDSAALRRLLAGIGALVARHHQTVDQVFLELPPTPALPAFLAAIAGHSAEATSSKSPIFGYKLRTGGSNSTSAPSIAEVGETLAAAALASVAMKCTGGLHRPLRQSSADGDNVGQGFINLLVAAVAAGQRPQDTELVVRVLSETQPEAFAFGSRALVWRDHEFPVSAVAATRERLLVSFGSCYANTPRQELQNLGWWPKPRRRAVLQS